MATHRHKFIIPKAQYRGPPSPYKRPSQITHYFKTHTFNSKIIVLDANDKIISKSKLFADVEVNDHKGHRAPAELVMDEFALYKRHRYATVMMDAQPMRVLWVGAGNTASRSSSAWSMASVTLPTSS